MNLPVVFNPLAEAEATAAADYYEAQAGLGAEFVANLEATLDRIGRMPESHPAIYQQARRGRLARFPYHVFYRILPDRIEVIAVVHARRDPSVWKSRA